jgi:hypothetical protein
MAFIGNTNTTQAFTPAVDFFSGNGSTTAFTLSRPVASVAQVQVTIDNVAQNPSSAYTVSSNTITFTSAPLSGTNNIYVYYTSPITQVIAPGQGTVDANSFASGVLTPTAVSDQANTSTGYFDLPAGTTAQRPASPATGMIRYNSDANLIEFYDGSDWKVFTTATNTPNVEYLVVAGGGGGATTAGGGGGAGGYRTATGFSVSSGSTYTVTIGAGGAAGTFDGANGVAGSNSVFSSITATGGGLGSHGLTAGGSGGSGGGAGYGTNSGGSATSGQGNNGGSTSGTGAPNYACGGGGGAGAVGGNGSGSTGGNGGAGLSSSISGSSVFYAGGGGGSGLGGTTGGTGGGGAGGTIATGRVSGTANTGGGGGGGGAANDGKGLGGSGVVIIRYLQVYPAATSTTGSPTVTTSGAYRIYTWTGSGSITF